MRHAADGRHLESLGTKTATDMDSSTSLRPVRDPNSPLRVASKKSPREDEKILRSRMQVFLHSERSVPEEGVPGRDVSPTGNGAVAGRPASPPHASRQGHHAHSDHTSEAGAGGGPAFRLPGGLTASGLPHTAVDRALVGHEGVGGVKVAGADATAISRAAQAASASGGITSRSQRPRVCESSVSVSRSWSVSQPTCTVCPPAFLQRAHQGRRFGGEVARVRPAGPVQQAAGRCSVSAPGTPGGWERSCWS